MTLKARVIACLDVDQGRVVKGVNFEDLRDMGDPVELAARYEQEGADEVVFLDITATHEARTTTLETVERAARELSIPLTVGGGVRSVEDMRRTLLAGADKVAINSAAVREPELIAACSETFGAQCVVVAIDAKRVGTSWNVFVRGGREDTGLDAIGWAKEAARLGAGELLVTSMDGDGTLAGFDLDLMAALREAVSIPLVASGGAGNPAHMTASIQAGANASLAASIFHDRTYTIADVKHNMQEAGIPVRIL